MTEDRVIFLEDFLRDLDFRIGEVIIKITETEDRNIVLVYCGELASLMNVRDMAYQKGRLDLNEKHNTKSTKR